MSKSGERHRRNLSPKCPKCGSRGAYMSPRELGGAEVRCAGCGHLYNNAVSSWPFARAGGKTVTVTPEPVSSIKTGG